MKKYKLKKEIKDILKLVLVMLVLVLLFTWGNKTTEQSIKECIQNGNSKTFCNYQLTR